MNVTPARLGLRGPDECALLCKEENRSSVFAFKRRAAAAGGGGGGGGAVEETKCLCAVPGEASALGLGGGSDDSSHLDYDEQSV